MGSSIFKEWHENLHLMWRSKFSLLIFLLPCCTKSWSIIVIFTINHLAYCLSQVFPSNWRLVKLGSLVVVMLEKTQMFGWKNFLCFFNLIEHKNKPFMLTICDLHSLNKIVSYDYWLRIFFSLNWLPLSFHHSLSLDRLGAAYLMKIKDQLFFLWWENWWKKKSYNEY